MANTFHRVTRSLTADKGIASTAVLVTTLLLVCAWITWSLRAQVSLYEVSDSARLEVDSAPYPVQANVSGRLISYGLVLGKIVRAGDVLAELDSNSERLSLEQERTKFSALEPQIAALRSEMESEVGGRLDERRVLAFSKEGAQAQYLQAEAEATLAEQNAERARRLHAEGILAEADLQKANAEAQSKRAAARSIKTAISRLEPELQVRDRQREVRVKELSEELAELEASRAVSEATVKKLEYEKERRLIRAPISGRLGESAALRPGSHISEGQQLGVILPAGKLQAIAEFQPSAALGKVRPGQPATLRLQGFPWAQYGTVPARVSRVASEIRDGKVRVELGIISAAHPRIPFEHGLPGSVEIEVERISPAALALRSAGELVSAR